jgi:nitrogen-specific signal transduction histidine kinase/CheY-like chemotaxis protein
MVETMRDHQNHSCIKSHEKMGKIFNVSTSEFTDKLSNRQYFVYVGKDITEQKKFEANVFQSHKMEAIGSLAVGIAHDFNNILQAIIGYADLVRYDVAENSRANNNLEQVLQSARRAKELVAQILSCSRKQPIVATIRILPHLIIKEVIKMIRSTLPASIQVQERIDKNTRPVLVDPTHLHQIAVNLLTNAYQAIEDETGVITVSLRNKFLEAKDLIGELELLPGPYVEFIVSDNGCGIEPEIIERIFEPYFTTRAVGEGSGIGLAVVNGIVKRYGGLIKVESEAGKGSTFKIYFPATGDEGVDLEVNEPKPSLTGGAEKILVVDDEQVIVDLARNNLEKLGYKVIAHTSSLEALEDFRSRFAEIDMVVLDLSMPYMTGNILARELLKIKPDLPILLWTGYSSKREESEAEKLGIKNILLKPVELEKLAKSIREILDESKK